MAFDPGSKWIRLSPRNRPRKANDEGINSSPQCGNDRLRPSLCGVGAQGAPQTIELVKVDVQKLAAGYSASKVTGNSVVNDANETIGKIDDLLVKLRW